MNAIVVLQLLLAGLMIVAPLRDATTGARTGPARTDAAPDAAPAEGPRRFGPGSD